MTPNTTHSNYNSKRAKTASKQAPFNGARQIITSTVRDNNRNDNNAQIRSSASRSYGKAENQPGTKRQAITATATAQQYIVNPNRTQTQFNKVDRIDSRGSSSVASRYYNPKGGVFGGESAIQSKEQSRMSS